MNLRIVMLLGFSIASIYTGKTYSQTSQKEIMEKMLNYFKSLIQQDIDASKYLKNDHLMISTINCEESSDAATRGTSDEIYMLIKIDGRAEPVARVNLVDKISQKSEKTIDVEIPIFWGPGNRFHVEIWELAGPNWRAGPVIDPWGADDHLGTFTVVDAPDGIKILPSVHAQVTGVAITLTGDGKHHIRIK